MANYFWWWTPIYNIFIVSFWWVFLMLLVLLVPFLRVWWWVFFPLFLAGQLRVLYLWWIQWDFAYAEKKWVVLEIIPPKEVLVPLKAMEDVFSLIWGPLWDFANWREQWCDGTLSNAPGWMSWEIASIEGNLHFYIRVMTEDKVSVETALYAHYPELEIQEVADYAKNVPQDIPNKEWDLYGEDYILNNPAYYPIRTYEKFFEPQGEKISAEEKRIDPINSLLESMSRLSSGEQFWFQLIIMPVGDHDEPQFKKDAQSAIAKISKRP